MIEGAIVSMPVVSRKGIFFWLFRSLVTVRYTFFLTSVLLGLRTRSLTAILVWVVVVFLAVLLHELGHAFAARAFGQVPQIELHAMGGLTRWAQIGELKWFQRVAISLAGPAMGFAAGGLLWVGGGFIPASEPFVLTLARYDFLWVTLAWGVFNLAPMFPLDGAHALAEVAEHRLGPDRGQHLAQQVSIATGVAGFGVAILLNETWLALVCALFTFDNYQRMRGLPGVAFPR